MTKEEGGQTGCKEVVFGVAGEHPESVVFTAIGADCGPLLHVPDADRVVLRVGEDEIERGMKEDGRDVVVVSSQRVNFVGSRI